MLEKVMELHFLLYAMMLMGGLGALGMLTTHLTYQSKVRKKQSSQQLPFQEVLPERHS